MLVTCKKNIGTFKVGDTYTVSLEVNKHHLYHVKHSYSSNSYYFKNVQSFFDHFRIIQGEDQFEEAIKNTTDFTKDIKWIIIEDQDPKSVSLYCPSCGKSSKIISSYWEKIKYEIPSILTYCGYCGHKNIVEV